MNMLYNPKEAGERLRISESTVYRFFRAHKLKGVKVDGALRFTEEELMAFIERHREPGYSKRGIDFHLAVFIC